MNFMPTCVVIFYTNFMIFHFLMIIYDFRLTKTLETRINKSTKVISNIEFIEINR